MKPQTMLILRKNQMVKKHMALMTTPLTTINLMMIPAMKQRELQNHHDPEPGQEQREVCNECFF